ncbi:MAG: septal ring lytic transglycosylase RlpA family protein [Alphaproteobacteria bacterium]|nr:septal ring lytic transglycosylase RlpA family protein [Alphaproteobacteria bacterium]
MKNRQRGAANGTGASRYFYGLLGLLAAAVLLQACGTSQPPPRQISKQPTKQAVVHKAPSRDVSRAYRRPSNGAIVGIASWYGKRFHGRTTASGQVYNMYAMTAAHRSLPFGTRVVVTNLSNGKSVNLVINDRGPFIDGRVIDVSWAAARRLGFTQDGLTRVRVTIVSRGS